MKRNTLKHSIATLLVVLAVAVVGQTVEAQGKRKSDKDALTVTAYESTSGVNPRAAGPQWHYDYCFASPQVFTDTYPVDYSLANTDGVSGETVTVTLTAVGAPQLAVTSGLGTLDLADDGVPVSHAFTVSSGGVLGVGDYTINIHMSAPSLEAQLSHNTIHIHVVVGPECESGPKCFFSYDDDFLFLRDCANNIVTANTGGTFTINTSGRGGVNLNETSPPTFFYNLLWENTTGSGQYVTIALSGTNAQAQSEGASCKALAFASGEIDVNDIAGLSPSDFTEVQTNGQNCTSGHPQGNPTILVGADEVLWVTWHVDDTFKGTSSDGVSNSCPGNISFSVTGTLTYGSSGVSCTATATGYIQ